MNWTPVDSANLDAVAYVAGTLTLFIRFRAHARVYAYADVPAHAYDELVTAPSAGEYFSANIRNKYTSEEIG